MRSMRFFTSALLLTLSTSLSYASGFILNEQSLNGTALNSAYVAGAYGADSSYYNPANMGFDDNNELELNATMIFIPGFDFSTNSRDAGLNFGGTQQNPDRRNTIVDGKAHSTYAFVPKMFFKTKALEVNEILKSSFGLSVTTPSGLTMDWGKEGGEFMDNVGIAMIEINPVMALTYFNRFSLGGGLRFIYANGDFDNTLYVPFDYDFSLIPNKPGTPVKGTTKVTQTSSTESWGVGFNLAASLKLTEKTMLSVTYRSKTHFNMKGKLNAITQVPILNQNVNMAANLNLSTDIPDVIRLGLAHQFEKLLAEFVYEHTFWNKADIFEFQYSNQVFTDSNGKPANEMILGGVTAADYNAVAMGRGWRNSNAFRLGLTYLHSPKLKFMGSLAYDATPVPQGKNRFGIPDANAYMLGLGARYSLWDNKADVGIAYSLALKDNRRSFIQSKDGLGQLHLLTLGLKYRF